MTGTTSQDGEGMPLHTKILIGLVLGMAAGLTSNAFASDAPWLDFAVDYVANPIGQIFLRMLFMVVVPLVFASPRMWGGPCCGPSRGWGAPLRS